MTATAVGYLRSDVSGGTQELDRAANKVLAERYGYEVVRTVVHSEYTDDPVRRLINTVTKLGVEAVFVPSLAHFGGQLPERLVRIADLNTVAPECTYARSYALLDASPPNNQGDEPTDAAPPHPRS